jgi:hypothetical protein
MNARGVGAGALVRMSAGAIVWVSAFVVLYSGYSLGCQNLAVAADAGLANPVTFALVAVVLLHGAVMTWLLARWYRRPVLAQPGEPDASQRFRHRVEGLVLLMSSAALVFLAFPVLLIPPCVG